MLKRTGLLSVALLSLSVAGCGDVELGSFTPSAPASLRAETDTGTSGVGPVLLTWRATNSTTPSQGATFNVYRGSGSSTGKVKIAQGIKPEAFTDSVGGGTWTYQVTATIYDLESGPSNEVSVTRQAGNTTFLLNGTSVSGVNNLSWSFPAGAASYVLYRGTTASGALVDKQAIKAIDAASNTTTYADTAVTVGSTYYYQLVVRYSNGNSQTTNEVAVTTR